MTINTNKDQIEVVNTQVVVVDITVIRRVRLDVTETTTEEEEEEEAAAELITTDAEITATALETNHAIDLVIVLVTDLEIDRETRKVEESQIMMTTIDRQVNRINGRKNHRVKRETATKENHPPLVV